MAIDWNTLIDKAGDAVDSLKGTGILQKTVTTPQGGSVTYRDFTELATLETIAKNKTAQADRETNGMCSYFEREYE